VVELIPVVEHGVPDADVPDVEVPDVVDGRNGLARSAEGGTDGLSVGSCGMGLTPPTPSSVEPIGMPTRPLADAAAIPVGDEADPAGLAEPVVMLVQVPEAVPVVPPPSKRFIEPGVVDVDVPVLPVDEVLVPVRFPAVELTPEHVAMLPVSAGATGDTPEVVGLTPADPSSVLPKGIPVPGTGGAAPMPSGEVMPSGDGALPLSWADAEPQAKNIIASTAITKRVIAVFSSPRIIPGHQQPFRKKRGTVLMILACS